MATLRFCPFNYSTNRHENGLTFAPLFVNFNPFTNGERREEIFLVSRYLQHSPFVMRSKIPCRSCGTKSSKSGFVYSGSDELCLCKTCYMKNHNPVPFEDTSTTVSVETQTEKEDFVLEGTVQVHNIDTNVCSQNTV